MEDLELRPHAGRAMTIRSATIRVDITLQDRPHVELAIEDGPEFTAVPMTCAEAVLLATWLLQQAAECHQAESCPDACRLRVG